MLPINPLTVANDSLYKFMALAFLACFVLLTMFSLHEGVDAAGKLINPTARYERSISAERPAPADPISSTPVDPAKQTEREKQIERAEQIERYVDEQLASAGTILGDVQDQVEQDVWTIWIAKWASLAISLLGFFLWYWKEQRHKDAILRKQAEDARRPADPKPKEDGPLPMD